MEPILCTCSGAQVCSWFTVDVQVVGDVLDVCVDVDSDGYSKDMCARKMELFVKTHAMRLCSSRATLGP